MTASAEDIPVYDPSAAKTATEMGAYVEDFINKRFPDGLPPKLYGILAEMVIDALYDGARFAEGTAKDEARIIQL